ncbi:hypoxia-inducible factor 1-alpha-like [Protopterus annectens]|uniref:hypoxia-inducible factor 1-alpha-like n=1 Tax=Protopterus annectens TaxID=7888 RepID=UPI001CFA4F32|nr:hypoxia-inducible factor 1-alpha-like [Protopterus annectens]
MTERKEKKRICSEKRREKSRDAARYRRSRESEMFLQLAEELPLPLSLTSHLDKASIMRLVISFLRLQNLIATDKNDKCNDIPSQLSLLFQALDGFLMVVFQTGEIIFLSENVTKHLGPPQMELIGQSLFDLIHPCDHEEIREILHFKNDTAKRKAGNENDFFIRMKCTLTSQGKTVNLKSASWKVMHCMGKIKLLPSFQGTMKGCWGCLVLLCEPIPFPNDLEATLNNKMLLTRHSMDMKFTFCDKSVKDVIGYEEKELLGHSVYGYYHALDVNHIKKSHHNLFTKGQVSTRQYRMLAKHGGYIWMQTDATVIYSGCNTQPHCVICMNYILSGPMETDLILSIEQAAHLPVSSPSKNTKDTLLVEENHLPCEKLQKKSVDQTKMVSTPRDTITSQSFSQGEVLRRYDHGQQYTDNMHHLLKPLYADEAEIQYQRRTDANATNKVLKSEVTNPGYAAHPVIQYSANNCCRPSHNLSSSSTANRNDAIKVKEKYAVPGEYSPQLEMIEKLFASDIESQSQAVCAMQGDNDLDLDTLAPYIPMDGEDFELTPITEEHMLHERNGSNFQDPLSSSEYYKPTMMSSVTQPQLHPSMEKVFTPQKKTDFIKQSLPLEQMSCNCWRAEKNATGAHPYYRGQGVPTPSQGGQPAVLWPPDSTFKNATKQPASGDWSFPPCGHTPQQYFPYIQKARYNAVWHPCQYKGPPGPFLVNSFKRKHETQFPSLQQQGLSECLRDVSASPPPFRKNKRIHSSSNRENGKHSQVEEDYSWPKSDGITFLLAPAPDISNLPVLNNLDCEVNAPLQGLTRLLQGRELLWVLDEASRVMPATTASGLSERC